MKHKSIYNNDLSITKNDLSTLTNTVNNTHLTFHPIYKSVNVGYTPITEDNIPSKVIILSGSICGCVNCVEFTNVIQKIQQLIHIILEINIISKLHIIKMDICI